MRKHWRLCLIVVLLLLLVTGGVLGYNFWMRCPIEYDNFARIENGMHVRDVEKLLGCPPGDYRYGHINYTLENLDFPADHEESRWQGDQGDLMIFHDDNKIVVSKFWAKGEQESLGEAFLHWFAESMRANLLR